jgi:phage host-nuclease inhibitor protein Gam
VTFTGSIDAVVESLRSTAWGRKFVRTRHELDKGKVADGLRGKAREALESEGLGFEEGGETFYIVRTVQAGTQAKVQR